MFEEKPIFIIDVRDYSKWISKPKVLGKRVIHVEIFFTITTQTPFRELIEDQLEFFQQEGIRVDIKRMIDEHTIWLECIVELLVDRVNMG